MKSLSWWKEQRSSTRLAFALQVGTRIGNAALGLWWTSALVRAMGDALYGLFLSFQAVIALGGLGDLGMGAIIGLRVGKSLGAGTKSELKTFLATARAAFLSLGLVVCAAGTLLSPWLPGWLGFESVAGGGSLPLLFALGSLWAGLMVFSSYIANVNYGAVNIVWPVLPTFILTQLCLAAHVMLAHMGAPLTVQFVPYVGAAVVTMLFLWSIFRVSHAELANFWPLTFRWSQWRELIIQSFWSYLWGINNVVFLSTARMLINAGFGAEAVPPYSLNNKLAELAFFFVSTAGAVSVPKLTQWLSSPAPEDRHRVLDGLRRLNNVQAFLGCAAAIIYLLVNDFFVTHWVGARYLVPLHWQFAFALTLAVTSGGTAAISVSTRCGTHGLRYSGIVVGIAAAICLALSFVAMKLGSIAGIAFAGVIAQSFMGLGGAWFICRHLSLPFTGWVARNWVLPIALVTVMYAVRLLTPQTPAGYTLLYGFAGVLLLLAAWLTNLNWRFVRSELQILLRMVQRTKE